MSEAPVVAPPMPASWSLGSLAVAAAAVAVGWWLQARLGAPDAVGYGALSVASLAPIVAWSAWRVRFEREQVARFAGSCDRVTSREVERVERQLESVDVLARGERAGVALRLERRRELRRVVYVVVADAPEAPAAQNE